MIVDYVVIVSPPARLTPTPLVPEPADNSVYVFQDKTL